MAGYHPFWVQMGEWMVVEWRDPRGLWIVRQSTVVGGRNSIVVRDRNDPGADERVALTRIVKCQ